MEGELPRVSGVLGDYEMRTVTISMSFDNNKRRTSSEI